MSLITTEDLHRLKFERHQVHRINQLADRFSSYISCKRVMGRTKQGKAYVFLAFNPEELHKALLEKGQKFPRPAMVLRRKEDLQLLLEVKERLDEEDVLINTLVHTKCTS